MSRLLWISLAILCIKISFQLGVSYGIKEERAEEEARCFKETENKNCFSEE